MWRGEIRLTWRLLLKKKVSAEETFFFSAFYRLKMMSVIPKISLMV